MFSSGNFARIASLCLGLHLGLGFIFVHIATF